MEKSGNQVYSSAVVVFLVTAISDITIVASVSKVIVSLLIVLVINIVMLEILYLAIKPV